MLPPELPRESDSQASLLEPSHRTLAFIGVACVLALAAGYWLYAHRTPSGSSTAGTALYGAHGAATYAADGALAPLAEAPALASGSAGAHAVLVDPAPAAQNGKTPPVVTSTAPDWHISLSENGAMRDIGPGRPLGFLPGGSLLALSPLGLVRIMPDGSQFQIVGAGGAGVPLGAAAADLSLVALEDQVTHAINLYAVDTATVSARFIAALPAPSAPASAGDAGPYLPAAVGFSGTTAYVEYSRIGGTPVLYAYPYANGSIGTPRALTLVHE